MNQEKNKQGVTLSRRTLILLLVIVLLLIGGGIILGMNWNRWFGDGGNPAVSETAGPDIDPDAAEYTGTKPKDEDGKSEGIKIPGYPSIGLPADTKDVEVALLNPEGNPCYFKFEVVLADTQETLYTSKLVPPGKAITRITLSRALPAGEYKAVIKISTTSLEDGVTAMNGANVETVLIVQ